MLNLCEDYGNYFGFKSFQFTFANEIKTINKIFLKNTLLKNER